MTRGSYAKGTRIRIDRGNDEDFAIQWRALGPMEAVVGGRLADLGPPRQRALFGLLLSRVDHPVALDVIIEELWSGDPPAAAMTSVRTYVSNLRRALEPERPPRVPATVLRTRATGYLLDSRGVDFDVHRFAEYAASGRAALDSEDPAQAVRDFEAALGLWRGRAYADVCDAGWAAPEVARLEELRLSVVEARCEAQLLLGDHHGAVAELEMHVRTQPLREHGCGLLALALYRAGREAEALGVLRVTRTRLAEELGIDPGAALHRLEHGILTRSPTLDWSPMKPVSAGGVGSADAGPAEPYPLPTGHSRPSKGVATNSDGPDDRLDTDLARQFPLLSQLLRDLAERGLGQVPGAVPDPQGGSSTDLAGGPGHRARRALFVAYRARFPTLVRYAARKVGDHSTAEAAVQRAFEKVVGRHERVPQQIDNLEAYLQTAVCHEINRELRRTISYDQPTRTDGGGSEVVRSVGSTTPRQSGGIAPATAAGGCDQPELRASEY